MKIGIDIVELKSLQKRLENGHGFVEKILTPEEADDWEISSLAGKIAAKEAIVKTGYIKAGQWHKIQIINDDSGAPIVCDNFGKKIDSLQVSISHTENIAVAVAIYEEVKNN